MKHIVLLTLLAGLVLAGCSKSGPSESEATNQSISGNPLTAPVEYVGVVAQGQKKANTVASTVGIQQAITMFYTQEGRYPKDLNELVGGDYLPELPDPPRGMKFDYNASNGQFKVVPQ